MTTKREIRRYLQEGNDSDGPVSVPNVVLLDKVMEMIENSKRAKLKGFPAYKVDEGLYWAQEAWRQHRDCGTAMCFAGWVGEVTGADWSTESDMVTSADGTKRQHIRDYAQQQLGLNGWEANMLFSGGNTKGDLKRIIEVIKDMHNLL